MSSAVLIGLHLRTYVADSLAAPFRELRVRLSLPARFRLAVVIAALVLGSILAIITYNVGVWPAPPQAN